MKSAILAALATVAQFGVAASSIESFIGDGPGKVPGAVIVNLADGKLTTRCFGFADVAAKKPMTENTVGWLYSFGTWVSEDRQMMSHGGAWSTWGCAYRASGIARIFFVQRTGGESKGFEEFRSLVEKEAQTSYSPSR